MENQNGFCSNCGAELVDYARFCKACGAKLLFRPGPVAEINATDQTRGVDIFVKKKDNTSTIVLMVLLAVGAFMPMLYLFIVTFLALFSTVIVASSGLSRGAIWMIVISVVVTLIFIGLTVLLVRIEIKLGRKIKKVSKCKSYAAKVIDNSYYSTDSISINDVKIKLLATIDEGEYCILIRESRADIIKGATIGSYVEITGENDYYEIKFCL